MAKIRSDALEREMNILHKEIRDHISEYHRDCKSLNTKINDLKEELYSTKQDFAESEKKTRSLNKKVNELDKKVSYLETKFKLKNNKH